MYTPEDSPFEKFRTEKLKGVAMSPDVLELVAKAYEGGFIDGMQKQMQSSVDRAVNRMAEQPAQSLPWHHPDCEGECIACLIEREVEAAYGTQGLVYLRRHVSGGGIKDQP